MVRWTTFESRHLRALRASAGVIPRLLEGHPLIVFTTQLAALDDLALQALADAALAELFGARTKNTYLAARYKRPSARRGPLRDLVAVEHLIITAISASRYLMRNYEKLQRKHRNGSFVLLLKVVNSQSYGPDVVELIGDVTRAAQA